MTGTLTIKKTDLSTIFVGNCEDSNNRVTIFPYEVVDILGKNWLPNDGNPQVSCHVGADAELTLEVIRDDIRLAQWFQLSMWEYLSTVFQFGFLYRQVNIKGLGALH